MDATRYPLLSHLAGPESLQDENTATLLAYAKESRAFLMESIGRTGGHLGAALGVVELTVALFNQFNLTRDRVVWDVGHQAHTHKLLTGRGGRFKQYGQWDGLCKFLERAESPYDHMGAGHASTAVSAALGMAIARDLSRPEPTDGGDQTSPVQPPAEGDRPDPRHIIAVIGDGAMTGGMAYEALSMAGALDLNLLVILNDNGMSIDANVGAFSNTITRITASDPYNAFRREVKKMTGLVPFGKRLLQGLKHMERSVKDLASGKPASFFESLGFRYFGPIDGHDIKSLVSMFHHVKSMRGPVLVHTHTIKGKGLGPDVENTFQAHAVSIRRKASPLAPPSKSWTDIYSEGLLEIMDEDPKAVAITAAMCSNTGLRPIKEKHPRRVFDVGIAEANGYCAAAGMAIEGLKPFVTIYSTFSQRAIDQMIHDIALQKLPVRIMLDRGGLVGEDGPTHHGVFDFSFLRMIPEFVHMAPRDEVTFRRMIKTAHLHQAGPAAIRYPRGETPQMVWDAPLEPIPVGKGELLRDAYRPDLLFIAAGSLVPTALEAAERMAAEGVACAVVDPRFIKPLDEELLTGQISRASGVLTLEENALAGGLGEAVLSLMARHNLQRPTRLLGVPDRFIPFGPVEKQLEDCGLTLPQVVAAAQEMASGVGSRQPVQLADTSPRADKAKGTRPPKQMPA
ncbi:MAG: 1-deoxy-D-xylulose-5-phosphate synthase [Deltaproteobacteria bacterium]|nr:1-deoxy-D-xylulose-5-phosphate synthase [Deltaproteobacteria bacterium]